MSTNCTDCFGHRTIFPLPGINYIVQDLLFKEDFK